MKVSAQCSLSVLVTDPEQLWAHPKHAATECSMLVALDLIVVRSDSDNESAILHSCATNSKHCTTSEAMKAYGNLNMWVAPQRVIRMVLQH